MKSIAFAAAFAACAGSVCSARPTIDDALMPVIGVGVAQTDERHALVVDIETPFGRSMVRSPELVTTGSDWASKGAKARASLDMSDLNFASEPDERVETSAAHETAVMFWRGQNVLTAGPDVFLFDRNGTARGVSIIPVYRLEDESIVEGEPVVFNAPDAMGRVEIGGRSMFGLGVDLDQWSSNGLVPERAHLAGVVIRHDGKGDRFSPSEIMMALDLAPGSFEGIGAGGGDRFGFASGLPTGRGNIEGGGGGGGRGGQGRTNTPDVPAPGGALLLGAAAAVGSIRRRRAE